MIKYIVYSYHTVTHTHIHRLKKIQALRPRKSLELEPLMRESKDDVVDWADEAEGALGGKRKRAGGGGGGHAAVEHPKLWQKVVPDLAVLQVKKGAFRGQAGAFAAKAFSCGEVISCYAGKLAFSSSVRKQAGEMLKQHTVAKWPPERGHPLIESVLATNFEYGPLNTHSSYVKDTVSRYYPNEDKELVIMPYPNYGNQSMAVNEVEDPTQQNCIYISVNYKGFPYIFLVALSDIRRGEELRCLMPKHNTHFHNRISCDFRLPGLVSMLSSASGVVPLTNPAVAWDQQLCARKNQIYFVEDPEVAKLRHQVEAEWAKSFGENVAFDDKVEILNKTPWDLDERALKLQLRRWLEPEGEVTRATTTWSGTEVEVEAEDEEGAGREKRAKRAIKDPSEPKRPMTAYMLFVESIRGKLKAEHPEVSMCGLSKIAGGKWGQLSAEQKAPFEEEYRRLRLQYDIDKVY